MTGPIPVIAKSRRHLVEILNDWKEDHPHEKPPTFQGKRFLNPTRMFNFSGTSVQTMLDCLDIDHSNTVRIARGSDDSCMLLLAHYKNNRHWCGYHAWLGGKLGFSDYTILHTCDRKQLVGRKERRKSSTSIGEKSHAHRAFTSELVQISMSKLKLTGLIRRATGIGIRKYRGNFGESYLGSK